MKKNIIFTSIVIAILSVLIGISYYRFNHYAYIIRKNWNIYLPLEDDILYSKDNSGWMGDGDRYYVLKYKRSTKIKKLNQLNWLKEIDLNFLSYINKEIDESLNIDKKYLIDISKKYNYYYKEKNLSKIYILYSEDENILYIIERLI